MNSVAFKFNYDDYAIEMGTSNIFQIPDVVLIPFEFSPLPIVSRLIFQEKCNIVKPEIQAEKRDASDFSEILGPSPDAPK